MNNGNHYFEKTSFQEEKSSAVANKEMSAPGRGSNNPNAAAIHGIPNFHQFDPSHLQFLNRLPVAGGGSNATIQQLLSPQIQQQLQLYGKIQEGNKAGIENQSAEQCKGEETNSETVTAKVDNSSSTTAAGAAPTSAAASGNNNTSSNKSKKTSLWERKCSILEEELEFRKIEFDDLQKKLEEEHDAKKQQKFLKQKQFTEIQQLKKNGHNQTGTNDEIIQYQQKFKEESRISEQNQKLLQQQQREIQKLSQELEKERELLKKSMTSQLGQQGTGGESKTNDADAAELSDLREQLIKSRKKEVELVRMEENWKEKSLKMEKKLMAFQEESPKQEDPRLSTAEQLLSIKMGK